MGRVKWLTADRDDAGQEFDDRTAKSVIAVAGDHVGGVLYADILAVRAQPKKCLRAVFGQHVRQATAHEQYRQR